MGPRIHETELWDNVVKCDQHLKRGTGSISDWACLLQVVLASGEEVQYDVLILATGSSGQFPVKFAETTNAEEAEKMYREVNDKVRRPV